MTVTEAPPSFPTGRATYEATVSVLTPLHVGNGRVLDADVDYLVQERALLVLRPERLLASLGSEQLAGLAPYRLSALARVTDLAPLAAYQLAFPPGSRVPARIREHARDTDDRPYVPGSALKGAIRTALLWRLAQERGEGWLDEQVQRIAPTSPPPLLPGRGHLPSARGGWRPGRTLERLLLGGSASRDYLRAMRVSDCGQRDADPGPGGRSARLLETALWSGRMGRSWTEHVWVECLPPLATLTGAVAYDPWPLRAAEAGEADATPPPVTIQGILDSCQQFATALMAAEQDHWRHQPGGQSLVAVYDALAAHLEHARRDEHSALLWLGWGTGWQAKTIGMLLPDETRGRFARPLRQSGGASLPRWGGVSPEARRVILVGGDRPAGPLGWVRLTLTPHADKGSENGSG